VIADLNQNWLSIDVLEKARFCLVAVQAKRRWARPDQ